MKVNFPSPLRKFQIPLIVLVCKFADVVEKDSRKVFEFAEDVEIFLISGFSRLDKEKRIIDCELVDNQVS